MARKPELGGHFLRPSAINKIEVMTISSRVDLVTQKRKAVGSQMHPDLMRTAGLRPGVQHGKPPVLRKA
jgi:hypothetical protein